jgi:hypothetical protein
LLLDVSGSIENYVDFIRKAARNFLDTVSPQDNVAIVLFNEKLYPQTDNVCKLIRYNNKFVQKYKVCGSVPTPII